MKNFKVNLFLICYLSWIWYCKDDLYQNFTSILAWKMDRRIDNYIKSKNEGLIMLIIKFEKFNSINEGLIIGFT